jgi:hypothetical protein
MNSSSAGKLKRGGCPRRKVAMSYLMSRGGKGSERDVRKKRGKGRFDERERKGRQGEIGGERREKGSEDEGRKL